MAEFSTSVKGNKQLMHDGYRYTCCGLDKDYPMRWQCCKKRKPTNCHAHAYTNIVNGVEMAAFSKAQHNHGDEKSTWLRPQDRGKFDKLINPNYHL